MTKLLFKGKENQVAVSKRWELEGITFRFMSKCSMG